MARETTFPRVFAIIAEDMAGGALGVDKTVAQIAPAAGQPIAIEEIVISSTEVVEAATCKVRIVAQTGGTFTLGPADVIAAVLNPGASFDGSLYAVATVEPTDSVALNELRHAEVIRVGVSCYMRFIPGSMIIYPGERYGIVLNDTDGGITYTVKITCSYE
jgi:hypothetical protein